MKSFRGSDNSLVNTFQTLSLNTSAANGTLGTVLINEQAKLLYLKFFDNERSLTMLTVAAESLPTTATLPTLATSATLSSAWSSSRVSCHQLVTFSTGEQRTVNFTQGSTAINWSPALTEETTSATIATLGVQAYPLPANVSKIKNGTITIGQLVYSPAPVQSVQEWTKLNALPYASSIPAYFFIYNNQIEFWPIPATTGEVITLNCQINVADMTYSDYTTGTIAASGMAVGSNLVVGSGTTWTTFPQNVDLTAANLFLIAHPPHGDGIPYQIQSFSSATQATLIKPVVNTPNVNGTGTYTIGQYPLLSSDFHDAIVYGALRIYFSSVVKDSDRYTLYNNLYNERLDLMKFYLANKQVNVDLSATPVMQNPNLFWQGSS